MDLKTIRKFALSVNGVILLLVFGLMLFFYICKAEFLVWYSIPTALVYIIGFVLIKKEKMYIYVRMVYMWLTVYMCITTICLGSEFGFDLYCFSMIPVAYATKYMSYKVKSKDLNALHLCLVIATFYLISAACVSYYGPIYDVEKKYTTLFRMFNATIVLGFLIYYTNYLITSIINSEKLLLHAAHTDRLTGLYNRHYMMEQLDALPEGETAGWLVMADIDDFKKINDEYGHNAGDAVLKMVSEKLGSMCEGCVASRWGGEEFLILLPSDITDAEAVSDAVRRKISAEPMVYEGISINVTITAGLAKRSVGQSIDEWVNDVDSKLYTGKKSGKNKVVC